MALQGYGSVVDHLLMLPCFLAIKLGFSLVVNAFQSNKESNAMQLWLLFIFSL